MNINQSIKKTLCLQRETLVIEPIHHDLAPVSAYVQYISELTGEEFCVVTIPRGSMAYLMNYRFASIPKIELDYYQSNGSNLVG